MIRKLFDPIESEFWRQSGVPAFLSDKEAEATLHRVRLRALWVFMLACLVFPGVVLVAVALLLMTLRARLELLALDRARGLILGVAAMVSIGAGCFLLGIWLVRRHVRKLLPEELNAAGVPTCERCGYHMRENVSGRCPECGRFWTQREPAPKPAEAALVRRLSPGVYLALAMAYAINGFIFLRLSHMGTWCEVAAALAFAGAILCFVRLPGSRRFAHRWNRRASEETHQG